MRELHERMRSMNEAADPTTFRNIQFEIRGLGREAVRRATDVRDSGHTYRAVHGDTLWESPLGISAAARAGCQSHAMRFKAYEALIALGESIATPADRRSAAQVYAEELAAGESHNYWGMPDALDRPARTLIGLGRDAALPALAPLLTDQRALVYEGSEEPAISEDRGYRVADLAGAIAARLLGRPFPAADPDPARRDGALRDLAKTAAAP
jgi:hypothetical protein